MNLAVQYSFGDTFFVQENVFTFQSSALSAFIEDVKVEDYEGDSSEIYLSQLGVGVW